MYKAKLRLNDFTNLGNKVQKARNKLTLDSDVILSDDDEPDYIKIDRNNITIDGDGHFIDAKGKSGVFDIEANNVVLKNIVFKNANADDGGVIVNKSGQLNIVDCKFINNAAEFEAGAILNLANLKIENSQFENNLAKINGGAIVNKGSLKAFNCTFSGNSSNNLGGTLINWKKTFLQNCNFKANHAKRDGGAINNQKGAFKVIDCSFMENSSCESGGAIINLDELDIYDSSFCDNNAGQCGGAVFNNHELRISDCKFNNNHADINGGAINNHHGAVALVDGCEFGKNSANRDGGALNTYGALKIDNSTLSFNSAGYYGGAFKAQKYSYLLIESEIEFLDNDAEMGGDYSAYAPAYLTCNCKYRLCLNGREFLMSEDGYLLDENANHVFCAECCDEKMYANGEEAQLIRMGALFKEYEERVSVKCSCCGRILIDDFEKLKRKELII